jgi:protein Mpv17
VLFATGDVTAQQLVDKRGIKNHDLKRTGRMALYGGCMLILSSWPSHSNVLN